MAGDLCAALFQADFLTLDGATVISVFLIMCYFIYFMCNPIASSLCDTEHPPYIKKCYWKNEFGVYIQYLHFSLHYLHM